MEDAHDSFPKRGATERTLILSLFFSAARNRIGNDQFGDDRFLNPFDSRIGEDGMSAGSKDGKLHFFQGLSTAALNLPYRRCRRRGQGLAFDVANDIHDFSGARTRRRFSMMAIGALTPISQVTGTGYATEIRRYDDEVAQIRFFFFWLIYRAMEAEPR